jgi:hypothetical protein
LKSGQAAVVAGDIEAVVRAVQRLGQGNPRDRGFVRRREKLARRLACDAGATFVKTRPDFTRVEARRSPT